MLPPLPFFSVQPLLSLWGQHGALSASKATDVCFLSNDRRHNIGSLPNDLTNHISDFSDLLGGLLGDVLFVQM